MSKNSEKSKIARSSVVQRYVRERDKALESLQTFTKQVNAHVGTAYNILAASLGYPFNETTRKYETQGRDLITLALEIVKKYQDADPSVAKIVERRDAPVEYEKKERVIISAVKQSEEVDERTAIQEETGDTSFNPAAFEAYKDAATHGTFEEPVRKETAYEAMADIATQDEVQRTPTSDSENPAAIFDRT